MPRGKATPERRRRGHRGAFARPHLRWTHLKKRARRVRKRLRKRVRKHVRKLRRHPLATFIALVTLISGLTGRGILDLTKCNPFASRPAVFRGEPTPPSRKAKRCSTWERHPVRVVTRTGPGVSNPSGHRSATSRVPQIAVPRFSPPYTSPTKLSTSRSPDDPRPLGRRPLFHARIRACPTRWSGPTDGLRSGAWSRMASCRLLLDPP
jgi:hypothetical protein